VEDTRSLATVYENYLARAGHSVHIAATAAEALRLWREEEPRLVLLDLVLPDGDGIEVLREIRARGDTTRVIVITAHGSINRAVEAMREGAFDFLVKPFDERRLLGAVENALASIRDEPPAEPGGGGEEAGGAAGLAGFIGSSPAMQRIYEMVRNIARSTATVFITGESGTGKEVCAQAIHELSIRRNAPFVPVNCAAIPRELLESELFGHLRGAFTGAVADKKGAVAEADGGTLFLDEIGEMDLALQTKLLRFLQTATIQPVGATTPHKVDVRIVCATNRDPAAEVRAGRFREDLYYRLHVVPIHLPPLRERGEDVIELAEHLLRRYAEEEGRRFERLSPETRVRFLAYPWPGNVRELQNVLRNSVVLHDGVEMTPGMLPPPLQGAGQPPRETAAGGAAPAAAAGEAPEALADKRLGQLVGLSLEELERRFIELTIESCGGSIPKAARMLDVSASTLYRKREQWRRGG
jgi:DNA-binding NtrC family response regulator